MLATANLKLHKIASNAVEVMQALPPEDRIDSIQNLDLQRDPLPSQRSLGVMWNLQNDALTFSISLPEKPFTRRGVLSVINSIYDPLGFGTPVTLPGRLLLRQLTILGNEKGNDSLPLGWDDPLPTSLWKKWHEWTVGLYDLQDIMIPRCYLPQNSNEVRKAEIHAFSDASHYAIGIAVYLKLTNQAEVVLGYIQNESRRFYVYVANRIQIIRSITDPSQWRYVETKENPADIATRGKSSKDLMESVWFKGPEFLRNVDPPAQTELSPEPFLIADNDPEVRVKATIYTTQLRVIKGLTSERFNRFSKWNSLRRAIANLIIKAKILKSQNQISTPRKRNAHQTHLVKLPVRKLPRNPSAAELRQSEVVMIKTAQSEAYAEEIETLQQNQLSQKSLSPKSSIYRLDPFVDGDGVLRVGGRLRQADQMFQEKHPAILPKGCHLARLAITHYHSEVHHQGRQITHGALRQGGLWIIGAKRMISKIINQCITCRKLRGNVITQHMANLPPDRLETPPPFTNVGFDVFGPWQIRTRRLRGGAANAKRWGLVFTCLNCRAIHIEVLETMDSSSFICALRRFFSIRGPPSLLRCDRGTNFVGAKSELDEALKEMDHKAIAKYVVEQNCEWVFNPPHASHFGGVWERQISTIRQVLNGMFSDLGPCQLTHELLVTLMAEVSGIVNSRPISTIPSDADQPQPLTPNMLLTMKTKPLVSPPGIFTSPDLYSRRHWRRAQYLADQFWSRWKNEYLQNQQRRSKWNERRHNLAVGDIVTMKEEAHRNEWPLGRVVDAVESSNDGLVRKVKIVIWRDGEKKYYLRPISQLVYIMST
ncbi:PREDICTED: uncharacterized protein LOC107357656 [Paramuricea clavata]|uniref:PREDICTED: uncharacterized protein LOC107357656 n=2 Tax=Paramuricea clavata TaxID=317549 RepID=A0A6S7FST7_PARCT|nr:PREDICTED: uncharacterized protein LOC107357656 [Paramuricea clavata]